MLYFLRQVKKKLKNFLKPIDILYNIVYNISTKKEKREVEKMKRQNLESVLEAMKKERKKCMGSWRM